MSDITLTSEIAVQCMQSVGEDAMILAARQASTDFAEAVRLAESIPSEEQYGRIRHAVRMKHGSCFEHGLLTFAVHAPAFVWWEWVRHRWMAVDCPDLSFNLESGRYKELHPVFWVPRAERAMIVPAMHKPSRPKYEMAGEEQYYDTRRDLESAYAASWFRYQRMLRRGIASEVARTTLPFGVYYSGWVSCNPRSLMHFLSLRTQNPQAETPSYPQAEIEEAARACEEVFRVGWPLTWRAWNECGRVAP